MNDHPKGGTPRVQPVGGRAWQERDGLIRRFDALEHLVDATVLDNAQRIYVNRTLRFDQIRWVGFDMDYTLAQYLLRNLEELSFKQTAKKLVENLGYPEEILEVPYDPSFVVRGLVVDKKRGNLFKMDRYHHVGRVYHGRRALDKDERRRLYRNTKIRLKSRKYHWIDTLFALPEAVLYADTIDLLELQLKQGRIDYWKLFDDIRNSIDECHRDGSLKTIVQADLAKYIEMDPALPRMLHRLRSSGKRLFVLTNSYWDYTNALMSFILNDKLSEYPNWQNYFDFTIVGSKKPKFFTEQEPFFEVQQATGEISKTPATRFERRHVYQGGSLKHFESILGSAGEEILYIGDHIYGDIIRSKKDTLWRTALIVPELEEELLLRRSLVWAETDLIELVERRASLENEVAQLKLQVAALEQAITDDPAGDAEERDQLVGLRRELRAELDQNKRDLKTIIERRDALQKTIDQSYNDHWGSLFKEGGESSAFARQVENYACLYTSKVSNFLYYSPHQYFRAPRHWLPHEKL